MTSSIRLPRIDLGAFALVLALGLPGLAAAAPEVDESEHAIARGLYRRGLSAYRAGDYDQAIAVFGKAYEKTLAPGLLFDIAQAHRRKGDCAPAALHFRRFIADAPASPHRTRAEEHLAEMDACLAARRAPIAAAPQAPPALDEDATSLPPDLIPVDPAEVGLATPEDFPAPPTKEARSAGRTAGLVLLGTTGLALAAGTVFAFRAADAAGAVSNLVREGQPWDDRARATETSGQRAERLAVGLYVTAAACAGVGTWLLLRDEGPPARQARAPTLTIAVSPGGAWAGLAARF